RSASSMTSASVQTWTPNCADAICPKHTTSPIHKNRLRRTNILTVPFLLVFCRAHECVRLEGWSRREGLVTACGVYQADHVPASAAALGWRNSKMPEAGSPREATGDQQARQPAPYSQCSTAGPQNIRRRSMLRYADFRNLHQRRENGSE